MLKALHRSPPPPHPPDLSSPPAPHPRPSPPCGLSPGVKHVRYRLYTCPHSGSHTPHPLSPPPSVAPPSVPGSQVSKRRKTNILRQNTVWLLGLNSERGDIRDQSCVGRGALRAVASGCAGCAHTRRPPCPYGREEAAMPFTLFSKPCDLLGAAAAQIHTNVSLFCQDLCL